MGEKSRVGAFASGVTWQVLWEYTSGSGGMRRRDGTIVGCCACRVPAGLLAVAERHGAADLARAQYRVCGVALPNTCVVWRCRKSAKQNHRTKRHETAVKSDQCCSRSARQVTRHAGPAISLSADSRGVQRCLLHSTYLLQLVRPDAGALQIAVAPYVCTDCQRDCTTCRGL